MFLELSPNAGQYPHLSGLDLAGDEEFDRGRGWLQLGCDRHRFDRAVRDCNRLLGPAGRDAFPGLFNQTCSQGYSGWEYWEHGSVRMLHHALLVAAALDTPLHVVTMMLESLLPGAHAAGFRFDRQVAQPVEVPVYPEVFRATNRSLAAGEVTLLTNVLLPDGSPSAPKV